jgi:DNA modification methylase
MFKYELVWVKNNPTNFLNAHYAPLRMHENILVFSKGKAAYAKDNNYMTYNPQGLKPYNKIVLKSNKTPNYNIKRKAIYYHQKYTNYPSDVLYYNVENGEHPTQKPVKLLQYLINTYSNDNSCVLDNTIGSGTTAIAAMITNRKCIGIEINKEYYDKAIDRANKQCEKMKQLLIEI